MVGQRRVRLLAGVAALVVIAAAMLSVGTAEAAKGGKPGGGRATAELKVYQAGVEVTSVPVGATFELRGSGFSPNSTVYVGTSGYFDMVPVTTDGSGCFAVARPGYSLPGSYTLLALVYRHRDWVIATTTTLPAW